MVEMQKELSVLSVGEITAIGLAVISGVYIVIRKLKNGIERRMYGNPDEIMSVGPTGPVNNGN